MKKKILMVLAVAIMVSALPIVSMAEPTAVPEESKEATLSAVIATARTNYDTMTEQLNEMDNEFLDIYTALQENMGVVGDDELRQKYNRNMEAAFNLQTDVNAARDELEFLYRKDEESKLSAYYLDDFVTLEEKIVKLQKRMQTFVNSLKHYGEDVDIAIQKEEIKTYAGQ